MSAVEAIAEVLSRHQIGAFCGTDTACSCDKTWRTNAAWRRHLAEVIVASSPAVLGLRKIEPEREQQ